MRTKKVRGVSISVKTKQDTDLAWAIYPYNNAGLDSREGVTNDPYWRKKIKARVDATHPYSRTIWPAKSSSIGKWNVNWTWLWKEMFTGKVRSSQTIGSPCLSSLAAHTFVSGISQVAAVEYATSIAKLAFLSKIKEHQNPFQGLPFLGELKETLRMIRHPLRGIIRQNANSALHLTRLQRLYQNKLARLEEVFKNWHLQWTYGISPLINDIQGAVGTIDRMFDDPGVTKIQVTIPVPSSKVFSDKGLHRYEGNTQLIGYQYDISAEGSVRFVGAMNERFQAATSGRLSEVVGMTARDIVPAVWELTGYSFLVDYFVNVGSVVGGLFTDTSSLVYCCRSVRLKQKGQGYAMALPGEFQPLSWPVGIVSGNLDKVSLNRDIPSLHVGIRDFHWQDTTTGQLFNTAVLTSAKIRDLVFSISTLRR